MTKRSEIDSRFFWRLDAIFESDAAWEGAFDAARERVGTLAAAKGTLGESGDNLFRLLKSESDIGYALELLYAYAHLKRDENNANPVYQGMTDRAMGLYVEMGTVGAYIVPEILAIPEDKLSAWLAEERFAPYRFGVENILRGRAHTLSAAEERILALAEEPLTGPDNIFSMLSDVDLPLGTVHDEKGNEVKLTHASYGTFLESRERGVRREAYEAMYRAYRSFGHTIAATYAASVKGDVFSARARSFESSLDAALFADNVPKSVYHNLVEAVNEKLPVLKKYLDLRRRMLGLDTLKMYDLYVPIVKDCEIGMPYEDAKALVRKALMPLGEEYGKLLDRAFSEGWIDVYETEGKTSGAFSCGVYGVHPFVLLNYRDRMDDAFTLAHELGHAMHSYHSDEKQPYELADYSILVAEVASTVNETLLTRYLLDTETDRTRRAYYLNHFLESFRTTCYRQTMFAAFEEKAHALEESGEPLTGETLSEVYRDLNRTFYPDCDVDDNIAAEWMRIPHFYRAFYVYQYATGLCSAVKLADDILYHGGRERYLAFLSSGGSDYPVNLLRQAGVDLTRKESILASLDVFDRCVDELEELLNDR